jgi:cytochrome c554/c'-like protein
MRKSRLAWAAATALALLIILPGAASLYYEGSGGEGCAGCHEIRPNYDQWHASTHRNVACRACHGDALTLDPEFHLGNLRRVVAHLRGRIPEQIRMRAEDIPQMLGRCQSCHRQEFADWQAGPHGVPYAKIFLDAEHNRKRLLMDDCLRCHGAHFAGGIRDLVSPVSTRGPWRMLRAEWADLPAIPCMACHQVHREGTPLSRPREKAAAAAQEVIRPSVALFDRRSMLHVAAARLPLPAMRVKDQPVRMSPDTRQALCYQCHAPTATLQVGSGDDRTGIGVHEGLSCLACHMKHGQKTRASCASCHPRLSNCGLDVEKMDTTFRSLASAHNVHFVKCADCHTKGVPKRRPLPAPVPVATLRAGVP